MNQSNKESNSLSKAPRGRVSRSDLNKSGRLAVRGKEPGYVYRFVNDIDDRVTEFQERGYEVVPREAVQIGDKRVSVPSATGSSSQVSVGQGTKAVLMRIKQEWYDEDRAVYNESVNAIERATKEKAKDGTYGDLTIGGR